MQKRQFERHLKRLALAPTLLALLIASVLTFQIYRQRQVMLQVDRADQEISAANHLQKLLIDMETGFRGYLLSGKEEFLEPYERAVGMTELELSRLRDNSALRLEQGEDPYGALRAGMIQWLEYSRREMRGSERAKGAAGSYVDAEGKHRMDTMRAQIAAILKAEESRRDDLFSRGTREFYTSISAIFVLCLFAAFASAYIARREGERVLGEYANALDETRKQGEQYRAIFDGVKEYGIALLNTSGNVDAWSPGAEALTNFRAADIKEKSFALIGAPGTDVKNDLAQAAEHGRYEGEGWLQRKDGSRFWADVVTTALFEASGSLRGYSIIFRDFTKRHHVEEEKAFLLRKLEEGVKSRDDFLILASHELKTPLTSVLMQLQLIERKAKKESSPDGAYPLKAETLNLLQRQVKRLTRLVETMLDLSRLHSGSLPLAFGEVDLSQLVEQAVQDHRQHSRDLGCPIEPRIEGGIRIWGDAFRLEQVIVNLIGNAFKYGCAGPIIIELERAGAKARFSLADRGPGIAPEFHGKIFERFGRARKSGDQGGLGLGLYIAKEYLESHGGTIRLESEPGQGAKFTFEIPIREVPKTS